MPTETNQTDRNLPTATRPSKADQSRPKPTTTDPKRNKADQNRPKSTKPSRPNHSKTDENQPRPTKTNHSQPKKGSKPTKANKADQIKFWPTKASGGCDPRRRNYPEKAKNSLGKIETLSAGGKGLAGRRVGWLLGWLAGLVWLPVWPASWLAAGLRGSTGSNIDAPKWGTEKGMEPKNGSNFGTPKKTSSDTQKHSPPRCPK